MLIHTVFSYSVDTFHVNICLERCLDGVALGVSHCCVVKEVCSSPKMWEAWGTKWQLQQAGRASTWLASRWTRLLSCHCQGVPAAKSIVQILLTSLHQLQLWETLASCLTLLAKHRVSTQPCWWQLRLPSVRGRTAGWAGEQLLSKDAGAPLGGSADVGETAL